MLFSNIAVDVNVRLGVQYLYKHRSGDNTTDKNIEYNPGCE